MELGEGNGFADLLDYILSSIFLVFFLDFFFYFHLQIDVCREEDPFASLMILYLGLLM